MLDRLAQFVTRRARWVVAAGVAFFIVAGTVGSSAFEVLEPFGFEDPDSESTIAEERFGEASGRSATADVVAVVETGTGVDSAAGREQVRAVEREIRSDPAIAETFSVLGPGGRGLVSEDGRATYVVAYTAPDPPDRIDEDVAERLGESFADDPSVTLGGAAIANEQIGVTVESDLRRAELIALPIILLLSLVVFRGFIAALLPPLVGILAIVGALLGLRLLAEVTDISIFAVNLVTGLGLGLAIDYSLFIVSRYREELARLGPGPEALRRTLATAGRTVLFSALTVAAALAALMVFPQRFLYSMGIGGALVALLAAVIALTVLPAVLALLGERINSLSPAWLRRAAEAEASGEQGRWYRFSRAVMRRPGTIAAVTATAMIALGLPFLESKFIFADAGVLPSDQSARQVDDVLEQRFDPRQLTPLTVQVEAEESRAGAREADALADQIGAIEGIREVSPPAPVGDGLIRIEAIQTVEPFSDRGQETVEEVRELESASPFLVNGSSARLVDLKTSLGEHLAIAIPIIAAATLILLFLMTGSVVLPIKALLMNLLTVCAAFGALVLIFQDGRFEGLLGYTSQGALDSSQPILLFALIFGLSTDYGVFLLTRIKEARDAGASDNEAVAIGLEKTGRIVTFAALLFCIAIGAFVTSDIVFIKQAGLGTAIGVILDATIVRALLVPSLMRLLGRWNWWAPRPLRRLHERLGFSEG